MALKYITMYKTHAYCPSIYMYVYCKRMLPERKEAEVKKKVRKIQMEVNNNRRTHLQVMKSKPWKVGKRKKV